MQGEFRNEHRVKLQKDAHNSLGIKFAGTDGYADELYQESHMMRMLRDIMRVNPGVDLVARLLGFPEKVQS